MKMLNNMFQKHSLPSFAGWLQDQLQTLKQTQSVLPPFIEMF